MFFDTQLVLTIVTLLLAGSLAGVAAGLFGIGGGAVLVPAFATLLPYAGIQPDVLMHMAVGTSLALIVPGGLMATRKQHQLGNLEWSLFWRWIPWVLIGVVLGVFLLNIFSSHKLKIFFVIYLAMATLYAIFQPKRPQDHLGKPSYLVQILIAPVIGTLSVLLGIGGGTFTVPFFKFSYYPLKKAIALSTATGLFIGLGGALGVAWDGIGRLGHTDHTLGFIYLPAFFLVTPMMMLFAPMGARLAHYLSDKTLHRVYIGFLAFMTIYMFVKVFGGLF